MTLTHYLRLYLCLLLCGEQLSEFRNVLIKYTITHTIATIAMIGHIMYNATAAKHNINTANNTITNVFFNILITSIFLLFSA